MNKLSAVYFAFCLLMPATVLAQVTTAELQVVQLYTQDELLQLWEDTKFTVIFVTHSIAEAIKISNRILLLSPHPGRVKAEVVDVDKIRHDTATSAAFLAPEMVTSPLRGRPPVMRSLSMGEMSFS